MSENAIRLDGVTKRYGWRGKEALQGVDMTVPEGSVYALLGRNGAGKTTAIRVMMGLLRRDAGEVEVLGLDPAVKPVEVRGRVGYLAEAQKMYDWMTVGETIRFQRAFFPGWRQETADRLLKRFNLSEGSCLGSLSRGTYGKVGLLLALAQNPELLVLDDPTMGLDPVARRQFMEGIVDAIGEEGRRTVLFSTHIVTEVERVADWVGIMDSGRLVASSPIEEMARAVKRIRLVFEEAVPADLTAESLIRKVVTGREAALTVQCFSAELLAMLKATFTPKSVEVLDMTLEDIFVAMVGDGTAE